MMTGTCHTSLESPIPSPTEDATHAPSAKPDAAPKPKPGPGCKANTADAPSIATSVKAGLVERCPAKKPRAKRRRTPGGPPLQFVGRKTCMWAGCRYELEDGTKIWKHMVEAHDGGLDALLLPHEPEKDTTSSTPVVKLASCGKQAKPSPKELSREESAETVTQEDEEAKDEVSKETLEAPKIAVKVEYDSDAEIDELPDEVYSDNETVVSEQLESLPKEPTPTVPVPVPVSVPVHGPTCPTSREKKGPMPWFERLECQWAGCSASMQYIALRRHIESKHIPARRVECPKGCGHVARSDMMGRHAQSCEGAPIDMARKKRKK
ncbi:hypothetical protein BD413DRAFT_496537 [Trametes elegans]|nr:hypothetical protein BD413DRAFT_496537 [Trametes elegans]